MTDVSSQASNSTDPVEGYLDRLLVAEGGFSDRPQDRGGATKYGISLAWARRVGLDLDGDGDTDADDIRLLTIPQARALYRDHFYDRPWIALLPPSLREATFDFAVHAGPVAAVKVLQRSLNELAAILPLATWPRLTIDGLIGPGTAAAASAAVSQRGHAMVTDEYAYARCRYYGDVVRRDPSQIAFIHGWLARAAQFFVLRRDPTWNAKTREVVYR